MHAAMDDLVAPLRAAGIAVTMRVPEPLEVSDYIEALVYRVAQEALRNARAHGHPSAVEVSVEANPHHVVLRVVDDDEASTRPILRTGRGPDTSAYG
jgi:two-component system NarL family sensor kinase